MAATGNEFVLLNQLKSLYDSILATIGAKVSKPAAGNGTSGQMLVSNGDGTTSWVDQPGEGGIGTGDLADSSVTTEKIADGAVTADKIAAGVIPDVSNFVTKTTADATYQPKGDYLTAVPSASDGDFKKYMGY